MSEKVRNRAVPSTFSIREATQKDAEFIESARYTATRDGYPRFIPDVTQEMVDKMYRGTDLAEAASRNGIRQEITRKPDTQHWLVAGHSGAARGYMWIDEDFAQSGMRWIRALYVEPDAQDNGIGTALLSRGLSMLHADNHDVHLHVIEGNPAVELYEKFQFEVVRSVPDTELVSRVHKYDEIEMIRPAGPL